MPKLTGEDLKEYLAQIQEQIFAAELWVEWVVKNER